VNTKMKQYLADPLTVQRVQWLAFALQHAPDFRLTPAQTRTSNLIRRAIEAYVVHVEALLTREDDSAELRRACERTAILQAGREWDIEVPPGRVLREPVRPLSEILRQHRERQPKPCDLIAEDLKRWNHQRRHQRHEQTTDD
jgi:hypothetical protein